MGISLLTLTDQTWHNHKIVGRAFFQQADRVVGQLITFDMSKHKLRLQINKTCTGIN